MNLARSYYFYRARYYEPGIGRFTQSDLLPGVSEKYIYAANNPILYIDPSGTTWTTNWNFFWGWAFGGTGSVIYYGEGAVETQEMMHSMGVNNLRNAFIRGGCKNIYRGGYGTVEAYWDTTVNPFTLDWSSTATQVGGFGGAWVTNNGNGNVSFRIKNVAGTHSFFLHLIPDRKSPTGPMSNITQIFQWNEVIQACKCNSYP